MVKSLPSDIHQINFHTAQIQTQSYCNSNCVICPYGYTKNILPQGIMDIRLYTKVIDELLQYKSLQYISLMLQNEPLLDGRISELIKYIKITRPDINVGITTNGSRLNNKMLEKLVAAGLNYLNFSINALTEKTFHKIQRGIDFITIMNNLINLINYQSTELKILIKIMLIKENHFEIMLGDKFPVMKLIKQRGIPLDIGPISNRAGSLKQYNNILIHENLQSSREKAYCHDIFDNINILFNGDVIMCCADWLRKSILGNLQINSLDEIWHNVNSREARVNIINGLYQQMSPCQDCSQAWNIMKFRSKVV